MSYCTYKIEKYSRNTTGTSWSTTPVEITDYFDVLIKQSIGSGKDTFEFKVQNTYNKHDTTFTPNDKILIYRAVNTSLTSTSDLLMTGIVQNVPNSESYNQGLIRVEGANYTEVLMNAIVFIDARALTIPQALEQSLIHIREYAPDFAITWASPNPSKKKDGTDFPLVNERFYNKPLRDLFEKYSQSVKTEDGNYYFYLDKDNQLHWQPEDNNIDYIFNKSTDDFVTLKTGKDLSDVKNFIIIKGGYGPDNTPIQDRVSDFSSIAKNGMKYYIITDITNNAKTLNQADMNKDGMSTGNYPSSYPFVTSWSSSITATVKGISMVKGFPVTVTSDSTYAACLRAHVKQLCKEEGQLYLQEHASGKLTVDLTFKVGKGWTIGNNVLCTIPSLNYFAKTLRIQDAQYSVDSETFTLIEDKGSL